MITRIQKIDGVAVLRDFSWPSGIPDLARRNLIYGWNGTGKTLLSEVLRCLQTGDNPDQVDFAIQTTSGVLRSDALDVFYLPVRVFTRSFVEETVFSPTGTIQPIVYIGPGRVAMKHQIDKIEEELTSQRHAEERARTRLNASKIALEKHCTDVGKAIRAALPGAPPPYRDYDKRNYLHRRQHLHSEDWSQRILSDAELSQFDQDRRAEEKPDISWHAPNLRSLGSLCQEAESLLRRDILADSIEALREDPTLEAWCNQGLYLHLERDSNECLFCGNRISRERLEQLRGHFSDSYQTLQGDLSAFQKKIKQDLREAETAQHLPSAQQFYDSLQERYRTIESKLSEALRLYHDYLSKLSGSIAAKRRSPLGTVDVPERTPDVDLAGLSAQLSGLTEEHNGKTSMLTEVAKRSCQAIEDHHVAKAMSEYARLKEEVRQYMQELTEASNAVTRSQDAVIELRASITPHGDSAKELNRDLQRYLGRDELSFEVAEDGYRIVRQGEKDAKGLSEGERTAIALLYFLQTLKADDLDATSCVIVLDDPVSSLDTNALFNAFSFIQEKTKGVCQLIILTHSFAFFRLARRWFLDKRSESSLYSLKTKRDERGERHAQISELDDLLLKFESEYHYLFQVVAAAADASEGDDIDVYHLPNTARRLLEAFVSFVKPMRRGGLNDAIRALDSDTSRAIRILAFTNTFSHKQDFESSSDQDMSSLSEARSVMGDVMAFIRDTAGYHYEEMMRLLAESRDASRSRTASRSESARSPS